MTAVLAFSTSGGTKCAEAKSQTEELVQRAHMILDACGYPMGPNKVARLVRQFRHRVEGNGFAFFDFLANAMRLSDEQRRRALSDPEIARVIAYADPTGEAAVHNILKRRYTSEP